MTTEVITTPEASIADLAPLLETHRLNGAPVADQAGHRETPSRFQRRLEKILGTTVREVMTPAPVTIAPETSLPDIAALMERKKVYTLPVLEEGRLVGIVGKMDLIRTPAREGNG